MKLRRPFPEVIETYKYAQSDAEIQITQGNLLTAKRIRQNRTGPGAPPPRITERGGYRPGAPPGSIGGPLRACLSHEERCVIHIRSNQAAYSVLPGNRLVDLVHFEGPDQVRRHRN